MYLSLFIDYLECLPGCLSLFLLFLPYVELVFTHVPDLLHTSPYWFPIPQAPCYASMRNFAFIYHTALKKIFQKNVDEKSPSKMLAIPDPYLPGSCIAGVCLELPDVLANGTLISVMRGKRAKWFINTIETKASNSWKSGTGGCCPSRDGRDRAEQFGSEERH